VKRQGGYTYIGLLIFIALMGTTLAAAGVVWHTQTQREREVELMFAGGQFAAAITQFYERTPAGQRPRFPARLEELLEDRRWPTTTRQLRRVYLDPMTGKPEWGIVRAPDGGILGVYSLSREVPIRRAGFGTPYEDFASAASYQDWRFVYVAPGSTGN
jgi:type II secretory pathway pseudopilin PulG